MRDASLNVLVMEPIKSSFEGASEISPSLFYACIRKNMLRHPREDGIYNQGNAWRVQNIIDRVESALIYRTVNSSKISTCVAHHLLIGSHL